MSQKVLLNATEVNIALHRLACQLIENHDTFSNTVLIGIQPRRIFLAERIKSLLETDYKVKNIELDGLDYLLKYEHDGKDEMDQFAFTNALLYIQKSKEIAIEF